MLAVESIAKSWKLDTLLDDNIAPVPGIYSKELKESIMFTSMKLYVPGESIAKSWKGYVKL